MASNAPDGALRVRLWDHLQSAFEIETSLPLSTRVANAKSAALAHYAARTLSDLLKPDEETGSLSLPGEAWKRLAALFSKGNPDFSAIVIAQAELIARAVAEAAQNGTLASDDKAELVTRVREQIKELPPELRSMAMKQALKSGDAAIIGLLASGTSLVGVGIAVKLAGFGAYIFAAQAAAIIPSWAVRPPFRCCLFSPTRFSSALPCWEEPTLQVGMSKAHMQSGCHRT